MSLTEGMNGAERTCDFASKGSGRGRVVEVWWVVAEARHYWVLHRIRCTKLCMQNASCVICYVLCVGDQRLEFLHAGCGLHANSYGI